MTGCSPAMHASAASYQRHGCALWQRDAGCAPTNHVSWQETHAMGNDAAAMAGCSMPCATVPQFPRGVILAGLLQLLTGRSPGNQLGDRFYAAAE